VGTHGKQYLRKMRDRADMGRSVLRPYKEQARGWRGSLKLKKYQSGDWRSQKMPQGRQIKMDA